MIRSSRIALNRAFIIGGFALAAAASLHTAASAEAPAPFSQVPDDAELLMRIDLEALAAAPAFASVVENLQGAMPNYSTAFLGTLGKGDAGMTKLSETYPGKVDVYEFAADLDEMDMATTDSPFYALAYGAVDRAAVGQALSTGSWSNVAALDEPAVYSNGAKMFLGTPTDSALAMATSPEMLASLNALATGSASAPGSAAKGPLATLVADKGKSPLMMAFHLTPALREQLAAASATPPQESYMIAGLPDAIKEGANLTSGAFALSGTDAASFDLSLGFADEAAAGRVLAALNKAIPAVAALGKMQAGDNPEALETIKKYEQLRFSSSGSLVSLSVPIPPEAMEMVGPMLAQQIQQSQAMFSESDGGMMSDDGATMDGATEPEGTINIEPATP